MITSKSTYWWKFLKPWFSGATLNETDKLMSFPDATGTHKKYSVTKTNIANSAAEVSIISASIPANDINDGDEIEITAIVALADAHAGGNTLTMKVKYGTDAFTIDTTVTTEDADSEALVKLTIVRAGTTLYIRNSNNGALREINSMTVEGLKSDAFDTTHRSGKLTSMAFNATKNLVVTAKFATADAASTITVLQASIIKKG